MQGYIKTVAHYGPSDNVDASFTTEELCLDVYRGYSVSFVLTDATADLSMVVTLEGSACSNGNFATITGTKQHFAGNDTVVYNCSNVFYKFMRVKCVFNSGSCSLLVEVTRKN